MADFDQDPSAASPSSEQSREAHPVPDENRFLFFGQLGKPHGLRGGIFVYPFNRDSAELEPGLEFMVWNEKKGSRSSQIISVSRTDKKGRTAVRLSNSKSRTDAEELRGDRVYLPWDKLEAPEAEAFYYSQVKGFEVVDPAGEKLGTVRGVFEGATDIFVVDSRGDEILIPVVKEIVLAIDRAARRVCVDLPEDIANANQSS